MNALLFLSSDDFSVESGTRGPVLAHSVKGFSLIFFYSTQCVHCQTFIPIFKKLPGSINGCQFGMVNVSKSKDVIKMSRSTIAPINYVPYICLYVNGKPFIRYDGPHDEGELRRFVLEVASKLQSKDRFSSSSSGQPATPNHPAVKDSGKGIPEYTIGKPVCENGVCYLEFEDAYH